MKHIPFGRWENFADCKADMISQEHDEESANKICGAIQSRIEKGGIYKSAENTLKILYKSVDGHKMIIGGNATWEVRDPQRDIITVAAQTKSLTRIFKAPPEYRNITVRHGDYNHAKLIKHFQHPETGQDYFSHVHEKGTFIVGEVRNDGLKTTSIINKEIEQGLLKDFSISALLLESHIEKGLDGFPDRYIDDMEYWAVTICEKGMNPNAHMMVLSKQEEAENMNKTNPQEPNKTQRKLLADNLYVWNYEGKNILGFDHPTSGWTKIADLGDQSYEDWQTANTPKPTPKVNPEHDSPSQTTAQPIKPPEQTQVKPEPTPQPKGTYENPTSIDTGEPAPYGNVYLRNQGGEDITGYYHPTSGWTKIPDWKRRQTEETKQKPKHIEKTDSTFQNDAELLLQNYGFNKAAKKT